MLRNLRKHKRYETNARIRVRMNGQIIEGAECSDLSLGGMCVLFFCNINEGNTGKLWLEKEYKESSIKFAADFKKIWSRPQYIGGNEKKMGILFEELLPSERDNLYKIVKIEEKKEK